MRNRSVTNGLMFLGLCVLGFVLVPVIVSGLTDSVFGLPANEKWVDAVKFFFTEVPSILLLLSRSRPDIG